VRGLLKKRGFWITIVSLIVVAYAVVMVPMSRKPDVPALSQEAGMPKGGVLVSMLVDIMDAQLENFGGWVPNDLPLSPGWFLDNQASFQLGVLQGVRHATRVLRDNLSRQRTSDAVHKEADLAYTAFNNDPGKWAFPSAEGQFNKGTGALVRFKRELGKTAEVYPRADNLVQLLVPLSSELGGATTGLLQNQGGQTSWLEIDNRFYFAQGYAFALAGICRAVKADFAQVLADKQGWEILDQIIESLEQSQFEPWFISNGSKDGILANHSANLKAYLDDARQKINSLIAILKTG
jgi:hypothetical protein